MLASNRPLLFTLFFALTLLIAFAPTADANGSVPAHRRQANRMLKKRAPADGLGLIGVAGGPPDSDSASAASATATTSSTATTSATDSATSGATTSKAVSASVSSTSSTTSSSTSSSTSSTSSSTSSTTSTSSSSSTTSSSSSSSTSSSSSLTSTTSSVSREVAAPDNTAAPDAQDAATQSTQTITNTLSGTADSASATQSASTVQAAKSSSISKTTTTVIIVIAASIGGVAIIWTIIRKWKFRPSAEFEDRMQPIDWAPAAGHTDGGLPGLHRTGSNASHGSFHSGSEHDSLGGGRPYGSNAGLVADIPAHDFTAGPAHLGGGYADLTRGASPAPQMSQAMSRGPSVNRGYRY